MRRVFLICAVWAVALARPELYKESEDFQFSRSSTDEGSKSGFYGAQRGNMGGNYERAHNMDSLAQHQMSGLVRQVDGELGDAANKRAGSVYIAANSRGVVGSGHYDISNLQGRNFHERNGFADSQSHSSSLAQNSDFTQQSSHRTGYGHRSAYNQNSDLTQQSLINDDYGNKLSHSQRYNGFRGVGSYGQQQTGESQLAEDLNSGSYVYGRDSGQSAGHLSQAGYHDQHHEQTYHERNSHLNSATNSASNVQTRLLNVGTPVRIVIRPGTRVVVPVAAQTYDATKTGTSFNHNAIDSDGESLARIDGFGYTPSSSIDSGDAKQYESSFSYKKAWEKHDTKPAVAVPLAIPTLSPYPKNSELYEDAQVAHSSNDRQQLIDSAAQRSYDSNIKSSSSRTRYNANRLQASSSDLHSDALNGAYDSGTGDLSTIVGNKGNVDTKPKSYQSSYSYHKSWERQGDPYVIKPASGGVYDDSQIAQKLRNDNQAVLYSHQRGSQYRQSHHSDTAIDDCDDEGQIRMARSANFFDQQEWENSDQGQIEDLGQHTQNAWEATFSQSQLENLENFGQQSHDQSESFKDFGQQTQNKWDNLENFGQQPQTMGTVNEPNLEQQSIWQDITQKPDVGQQTQDMWGIFVPHDFSQTNDKKPTDSQVKPVWEDPADETQQVSGNLDYFSSGNSNSKPWMQPQSNGLQQVQSSYGNNKHKWNSGMNDKHEHDLNLNNNFNSDSNSRDTSSLQSLWNKIDNLENVNTINEKSNVSKASSINGNSMSSKNYSSFQHNSWGQQERTDIKNITLGNVYDQQFINSHSDIQPWQSTEKDFNYISTTSQKPNVRKDNTRPFDIGRGDIESEDSYVYSNDKLNKTFDEIAALSLTHNTDQKPDTNSFQNTQNSDGSLLVVSISEQKRIEEQQKLEREIKDNLSSTTSTTTLFNDANINLFQSATDYQNTHRVNVLKIEPKSSTDKNKHTEKSIPVEIEQQNIMEIFDQNSQNKDNLDQQSKSTWEQNLEGFRQETQSDWEENFEQQSQTRDKFIEETQQVPTDLGQKLKELGQSQTKLDKNSEGFYHQTVRVENVDEVSQQVQTAWDDKEDLTQKFRTEWGQNLREDGQQSRSTHDKNFKDYGQQTDWDQNVEELGQQVQTTWDKNGEDLTQQSHTEWGQNLREGSQQSRSAHNKVFKDLDQKTVRDRNVEELGQQLQKTWDENSEDLTQQTQTNWGENLKDLSQKSEAVWERSLDNNKQVESLKTENYEKQGRNIDTISNQDTVQNHHQEQVPQEIQQHKYHQLTQSKKIENMPPVPLEVAEPEITTPKPGIWSSFKHKISNAKDKVSSWFQS